ncbi:hypothetical protein ARMSODRAFT_1069477 [Armillaria solidipes]|uniref:Uncharacterized protein n=1 Tax=Armillaria solidipes TaxID=1076256 RepID=A0A2H3BYJ8_9AGAR|nr:hypothetical protein ARMSODRAFT_1069477 [Armillaria solidipes]
MPGVDRATIAPGISHCTRFEVQIGCRGSDVCRVEALCPTDRDTIDTDGPPIHDIYDRELNAPFTEIFRSNGHKITFFADCCHVSGTSRDPDPEIGLHFTRTARRSNINDMLP